MSNARKRRARFARRGDEFILADYDRQLRNPLLDDMSRGWLERCRRALAAEIRNPELRRLPRESQ